MARIPSTAVAIGGVVAIAAAATLRFAVVPSQAQLPADTDTQRTYAGTMNVILNAEALAAGDFANALVTDVPVTLTRSTVVTDVADGNATVAETGTILAPDGTLLAGSQSTYVVDRKTMLGVGDRTGLVMGWPIGTEARDYQGWSSDLGTEVTLTYEGNEDFQGIDAYRFSSVVQGQIIDEATLAQFPASVPKEVLPGLAQVLAIPEALTAQLPTLLALIPGPDVPLAYVVDSTTTYWVDPATGMVLDLDRQEARQVAFAVPGVPVTGIADVYSIDYSGEAASVAATVAESNDNASQLNTFGVLLPGALFLLGLLLLGFSLWRRNPSDVVVLGDAGGTSPPTGGPATNHDDKRELSQI